jgi:hypothetical protein
LKVKTLKLNKTGYSMFTRLKKNKFITNLNQVGFALTLLLCQYSSPALAQEDLSRIDFKVKVPSDKLEKLLLKSGIHSGDGGKEVFIDKAVITLHNPKLGKTSSVGELRISTEGTIQFRARRPLRFGADTADTSVTFGTLSDRNDDTASLGRFTGRWISLFGERICPGQVVNLPGESQCI